MSRTYTTVQGDTWDSIAYKALGSGSLTARLIEEDPEHRDFYFLPAGIELALPEEEPATAADLPPWRGIPG